MTAPTAPTAGQIIASLARRRFQTDMAALGEIADADAGAVRRALESVPRTARIDVPVLVATLRRQAEQPTPMSIEEREALEAEIEARLDALRVRGIDTSGSGAELYEALLADDEEDECGRRRLLDDVDDYDDEPEPEPPSRLRLRRSRGAREGVSAPPEPTPPADAETATSAAPTPPERAFLCGQVFGAGNDRRPFGCPTNVSSQDYDRWSGRTVTPPPWLLPEDEETAPS